MKKLIPLVCLSLVACALMFTRGPAQALAYTYQTVRVISRGAPQVPLTCALTAAGNGCCVRVGNSADIVATCDAASPAYFRAVASYGAADGGFPDAGSGVYAVLGVDNYMPAKTPTAFHMPPTADALCMVTADGGTLSAGVLSP